MWIHIKIKNLDFKIWAVSHKLEQTHKTLFLNVFVMNHFILNFLNRNYFSLFKLVHLPFVLIQHVWTKVSLVLLCSNLTHAQTNWSFDFQQTIISSLGVSLCLLHKSQGHSPTYELIFCISNQKEICSHWYYQYNQSFQCK